MRDPNSLCAFLLGLIVSSPVFAAAPGAGDVPPGWPNPIHDDAYYGFLLVDRLEVADNEGPNTLDWELVGWFGGDFNRLWLEAEGAQHLESSGGEIERLDVSWGRLIAPFWDLQLGVGTQRTYGPDEDDERHWAVVGLQGLAPGMFEVDANIRLDEEGVFAADLEVEYDLLITQRLMLQPSVETAIFSDSVEEFGIGEGLNRVALGLRLRYEIVRQFAPYIGVQWTRSFGETADFARSVDEPVSETSLLAGVRMWF
ncbi:MAG: copper resistance protein B [Pseudomonadota bacterium]|nr:copper resistance protein B [Pseudomonadota bacterium]